MKKNMKRNLLVICVVTLVVAISIGGTLAYFSDSQEITNPFTMAGSSSENGTDIEVTEPGYNPDESADMVPGDVIVKDPTVKNLEGDAYVRFVVKLKDKDTGELITDQARVDKILSTLFYDKTGTNIDSNAAYSQTQMAAMIGTNVKTPYNSDEFTLDTTRGTVGQYYYNYNGIMPKDATAKLFTNVVIFTNWNQTDLDLLGNFDLVVTGQAIQAANMADANEAFTALDGEIS